MGYKVFDLLIVSVFKVIYNNRTKTENALISTIVFMFLLEFLIDKNLNMREKVSK